MFISRAFGGNVVSIRVRPWVVLAWAVLVLVLGGMLVIRGVDILLFSEPFRLGGPLAGIMTGVLFLIEGGALAFFAMRHISRAVRTFLS